MLDTIGEVGAPWGSWLFTQHILAKIVATSGVQLYGFAINMPRTRPKLMDGKNSEMSTFSTHFVFGCSAAFDFMLQFLVNPWTAALGS